MTAISNRAAWETGRPVMRTMVVLDLVESVRLFERDEAGTVRRWQAFVNEVETRSLPQWGGRLVKSTGDGMILEFPAIAPALKCAVAMQDTLDDSNVDLPDTLHMRARIGVHIAAVYFDEHDVYGRGVNLAARLAALAEPGQIVISNAVRDRLVPGLDPEVEHIGACYLKHIEEPVDAYRIRSGIKRLAPASTPFPVASLVPKIAIIPFEGRLVSPPHNVLGELIADAAIARLSASDVLRVISRLSTSRLSGRAWPIDEIGALLGATFIASGSYHMLGDRIFLVIELADARSQEVIWADQIQGDLAEVLAPRSEIVDSICAGIMTAIAMREMRRAQRLPLPTLDGFSLQLAAATLMHRSSPIDFNHAGEILDALIERHPRAPEPRAWLAKWYVLRVTRGVVENPAAESVRALEQTRRALDASPECSLALAAEGFVRCHMLGDLEGAAKRLNQALSVNPNDSLAWLFSSVVQAFRGDNETALTSADRAIELSPVDPLHHYYDALACSVALAARKLPRAIELATRSLSINRNHLPTLRALTIAQVESGSLEEARRTAQRVLALQPGLTLRDYVARAPKGGEATRIRYAAALGEAGIPAQ